MKKKILAICLCIAMLAIAIVGGTLAYFTDADADVNVMTTGQAKIVQNEQQRKMELVNVYSAYDENGEPAEGAIVIGYDVHYAEADKNGVVDLEAFNNDKLMVPAVYYTEDGKYSATSVQNWGKAKYDEGFVGTDTQELLDKSIMNEVDKIVTVTNKGTVPVYVRTVFLFEDALIVADDVAKAECKAGTCGCPAEGHYLSNQIGVWWTETGKGDTGNSNWDMTFIEINGTNYISTVHYYEVELMPGQTTAPSLKQIALNPVSTHDSFNKYLGEDGKYSIIAFSQAVQADGFDDDEVALNAAFGEVIPENIAKWVDETEIDTEGPANNVGGGN